MADLSAKVKHLEYREKVILHRLRMKGCLAKALDNDRSQLVEAQKTANSLIKALNDELDLQKQGRKRKTQRVEEPRKKTRLVPSAPFMSIGQMVWNTMMHFFHGNWSLHGNALIHEDSMVMQLTPDDIHEISPAVWSQERSHPEPPVTQDMDWISTADPPPEGPPGLQRGSGQPSVTFNIGDESIDQSSMRRSSLEDTFGDMDWSTVLAASAVKVEESLAEAENISAEVRKSLDEEDHARSLQMISNIADEAEETKRLAEAENTFAEFSKSLDEEDHARSLQTISNIAGEAEEKKKLEDAEAHLLKRAMIKRFLNPDSVVCTVNGRVVRVSKRLLEGKTPVALKLNDPESILKQEKILAQVAAAVARNETDAASKASKIGNILIAQKMNDTPICVQTDVFQHLQKEGSWPKEEQKTCFFDEPPIRPKVKTVGEARQEEAIKEIAVAKRAAICGCTNAMNPYHTCAPRCVEVGCNGRCLDASGLALRQKYLDDETAANLASVEEERNRANAHLLAQEVSRKKNRIAREKRDAEEAIILANRCGPCGGTGCRYCGYLKLPYHLRSGSQLSQLDTDF